MARVREGDGFDGGDAESDKEERGQAVGTPRPHAAGIEENAAGGALGGEDEAPIRISLKITFRRIRIQPKKKRQEYIARLERIISICEQVLSGSNVLEKAQLRAAEVIIEAIRMSYTIVRDVDVENLERIAAEIQERLEERDREGREGSQDEGPSEASQRPS